MGCSSSAQTQVKDGSRPSPMAPGTNGLQKCDDNSPLTDENETIPDQTKLGGMDEVDLASDGTKLSENLPQEKADVLLPEITKCALSACQRVDPEGTEPPPVAPEEKFSRGEPLPTGLVEASEPQPVELTEGDEPVSITEAANAQPPEITQDAKPELVRPTEGSTPEPLVTAEEDFNLVTEMVKELQIEEEEQLIEGEMGEKVETEMHSEIVSEGSETKEEETGEATAATEIEATNNEE
ncbi:glutamate-rich protein 5 isoform X2 [Heteronotia binoei]|uniref:glutamate-rich protein 5 isoform X2 n=1 Tax=Heteronotia binoei TaxID=13085 RepID=UPI002931F4B7|nr:glutamate-rich protein 5 isoform X2 [Heteronotia binoei]